MRLTFTIMKMFQFTYSSTVYKALFWNLSTICVSFPSLQFYTCKQMIITKLEVDSQTSISTLNAIRETAFILSNLSGEIKGLTGRVLAV